MKNVNIPETIFKISELKKPITIFGIDEAWVEIATKIIEEGNPNSLSITTFPSLHAGTPSTKELETIERINAPTTSRMLPNQRIVMNKFETYIEIIAINRLDQLIRGIVYDDGQEPIGWITFKFEQ